MIFEFTNHTAKDMFANCRREDTFMNCMENTLSNHMENTFSNHMKNTFSNHTENTFANPMENTFTNNMENTFTYNIENSFAYPIENSFTYNIENSFAYPMENSFTYPMENSFINNMRNLFMNHTRDMFSNYLDNTYVTQINEDAKVDKGIGIDNVVNKAMRIDNIVDKGAKVDECMRVNEDVDNGTKVDTCAGADEEMSKNTEFININCTESDIELFEVIQDEISCKIFSWDLLPDFLQAIFPPNYTYYTNEGFEIQQFEVDLFVNVSTVEDIKTWFSTFERHSKTTMPQTKGYGVKGKHVIFRESRHCVHSQIVRKKQGDVRRKYPESARNRNTGCLATMCLRLERQRLTNSHPLEVNISFKHNHVINSAESLSFRR
ncbi:34977_t:CDS:2, partial [Gigaspora margarita]